ncbi:NAD(P)H-hydrate epimerase [Erythrobacter arachoides]|uniref:Bifunctional NAD(P)H-hydrate repair enzyme n=1 Tax=Aurantiacibacter arachoides TaxID=1850444 RepID=A0A845A1L6_9SPHN|nr:NAD(P)H-hydrate epimerase [Aurantiacibacter arachoides]MXO93026.1 NAD(P)H-hydrate epimerase [Aurantiacibacter arachoides]GGD52577.1 bifunctional NAD(P)H-hydrate repair enzyme [Aurantiacibacter arachoides]
MAPNQILTAAQMRSAEQRLIDGGETVESLMERAGAGAAEWIWRLSGGRAVTVLCGPGNNGGDGYVIARVLAARGCDVQVVAPIAPVTDAATTARARWNGTPVQRASGEVFVDCLFGTGLARPLSDDLAHSLSDLALAHETRVAVDLPSGVHSDTGALLNDHLPDYDLTLALGAWKCAHWLMPVSAKMGERRLIDLGVGEGSSDLALAQPPRLRGPAADEHKYSRGLALVIGGEMIGAAVLAARAAQHSGAGYVKLLSEHSHPDLPADVVHIDGDLEEALADERLNAVLVGPGLGRGDLARHVVATVLGHDRPTVLDADALAILSPELVPSDPSRILITPHAGELLTLCKAFGIVREGKVEQALALAEASGMTVLAKGPDNVLAAAGKATISPPAPQWLSTAGTGDALAGIATSRMACGETPSAAALTAVTVHAEAARLAGPMFSASGLIASIPEACGSFL